MSDKLKIVIVEILAFILVYISDIQSALFAIGFLIMIDTFTGMWAAYRDGGVKKIQSRKMGRIVSKLVLYPLSIIVAKVSQDYLSPTIPWIDVTMGILAVVEVKSIFENISLILGFDLWQRIKDQIWKDKKKYE